MKVANDSASAHASVAAELKLEDSIFNRPPNAWSPPAFFGYYLFILKEAVIIDKNSMIFRIGVSEVTQDRPSWPLCVILAGILGSAILAGGIVLGAREARADDDSFDQAQAGLAQAYSQYYKALRESPGFSKDKAKELADRYLSPANAKVAKAIDHDYEKVQKIREKEEKEVPPAPQDPSAMIQSARAPASAAEPAQFIRTEETAAEPGLDGSNVPQEIDFPGPSKPGQSPAAAPSSVSHRYAPGFN